MAPVQTELHFKLLAWLEHNRTWNLQEDTRILPCGCRNIGEFLDNLHEWVVEVICQLLYMRGRASRYHEDVIVGKGGKELVIDRYVSLREVSSLF